VPRIFISYRRDDSAGQAGRLFDTLSRHFGEDNVFMDVDTIDLGTDFRPALQDAVRRCDIMLVVIGRDWLDCTDPTGARRLDNADDWVRVEIAEALRRNVPVIPILVRGASVVTADRLPREILSLADRQATAISDDQWRSGVNNLISRLEAMPRRKKRERFETLLARVGAGRLIGAIAGILVVSILSGWMLWPRQESVPSIVGKSVADAKVQLSAVGLTLDDHIQEAETTLEQAGKVIRQDPSAGIRVSRGQSIRVVVGKIPLPVDLSSNTKIHDVGAEGTIAAVAAVTGLEIAFEASGRSAHLSERYLYEKAKHHDEIKNSEGTWMTSIVYIAEQFGVPPYDLWPYKSGDHSLPNGTTWEELDHAASSYKGQFVRISSLEDIYDNLRQKHPVVAAVRIGDDWYAESATKTGVITANKSETSHLAGIGAITFVGFDPATGVFRFANSWGPKWGQEGFGTMSMETAKILIDPKNMWAIYPGTSH
jgi:hypothetical protein